MAGARQPRVYAGRLLDAPEATAEAEATATIYLQAPVALKARFEEAARRKGVSVNAFILAAGEASLGLTVPLRDEASGALVERISPTEARKIIAETPKFSAEQFAREHGLDGLAFRKRLRSAGHFKPHTREACEAVYAAIVAEREARA